MPFNQSRALAICVRKFSFAEKQAAEVRHIADLHTKLEENCPLKAFFSDTA